MITLGEYQISEGDVGEIRHEDAEHSPIITLILVMFVSCDI